MSNDRAVGIIPARYASSRLPGKPLALIAGKTMIQVSCTLGFVYDFFFHRFVREHTKEQSKLNL